MVLRFAALIAIVASSLSAFGQWPTVTVNAWTNWRTCTVGSDVTAACSQTSTSPNSFTWTMGGLRFFPATGCNTI